MLNTSHHPLIVAADLPHCLSVASFNVSGLSSSARFPARRQLLSHLRRLSVSIVAIQELSASCAPLHLSFSSGIPPPLASPLRWGGIGPGGPFSLEGDLPPGACILWAPSSV